MYITYTRRTVAFLADELDEFREYDSSDREIDQACRRLDYAAGYDAGCWKAYNSGESPERGYGDHARPCTDPAHAADWERGYGAGHADAVTDQVEGY